MMKLILFDIDGTLISVRGAITRAVIRDVVARALDRDDDLPSLELHGKTDRQIMRELCAAAGCAGDGLPERIALMESILLENWERHLSAETIELLPGVRDLLERLALRDDVRLGLLTGNLERAARMKLAPHDLNRFFPIGSFGSDAVIRDELPPIALERARHHWGDAFDYGDTMIVGDSHRDISCARAWGIRSLAVATGVLSAAELSDHLPDDLCESLLEEDVIDQFIGGN
ncbi:MAG: Haloacid dehalogenase domain protein hydrolase [Chlorobi bacterium]|nr:Haloacid dehalogenase domain protein hydrolase [Chlorobiota bacterium]